MSRTLQVMTCVTLALLCQAQDAGGPSDLSTLSKVLNFETDHPGGRPGGWGGGPQATLFADDKVVHGGHWSARLERNADSANGFSTITKGIPIDFAGKTIELRGFLRTEDVSEFVGLWLREDGEGNTSLAFDNMQSRQVKGTHDWAEYSIVLPLRAGARMLFFGALIGGTGKLWVDDLQLLVDGKPVWEAPKVERPKTPADTDHEFDKGSGHYANRAIKGTDGEPGDLGKGLGISQIPPFRGHIGEAALGLRVVPRDAGRSGGARSRGCERGDGEVDRGSGRSSQVRPLRHAGRGGAATEARE